MLNRVEHEKKIITLGPDLSYIRMDGQGLMLWTHNLEVAESNQAHIITQHAHHVEMTSDVI